MWLFSHRQLCARLSGHIKLPNIFHGCINGFMQAALSVKKIRLRCKQVRTDPVVLLKYCLYCNAQQASKLMLKDICCFPWSFCSVATFQSVECSIQVFQCVLSDAGQHGEFWGSFQKPWRCEIISHLLQSPELSETYLGLKATDFVLCNCLSFLPSTCKLL